MVSKKSRTEVREKKHSRMRNHLAGTAERPRLAVCKFRHTRYGGLSICCQYFNSIRIIHNTLNIRNAWFQCVFTIRISKIINRIISFRFKTLDRTYRTDLR
mgnify:CR=1 FL=1